MAGGFDQLVSSCSMRQFLKWKPSLMQDLKAEVRHQYFMDIFRLRGCPTHRPCEPAGECRAEHTTTVPGLSVCGLRSSPSTSQPLQILWSSSARGDNNRTGDTVVLSNLSEIRILMRVRGTRAGGPNLEAGILMLFSWAEF